jgi:hypothetical protein
MGNMVQSAASCKLPQFDGIDVQILRIARSHIAMLSASDFK